jgi:hypothetical protein
LGTIKKNDIKPWLKKSWCLTTIDGEFLARMEDVLDLYERPYSVQYPVVCVDERPCQLIGDIVCPLPCEPGKIRKEDSQYKRKGTCAVFVAVEPLRGFRLLWVRRHRTKKDYALFMNRLAALYPKAKNMYVVQDNLNTHSAGSFYETLPASEARRLAQRFEFHYTPKKASWLNMAEIELSALSKQCLDRRIPTIKQLAAEVRAFEKKRNSRKTKICWRFTTSDARVKMTVRYQNVLTDKLK